MKIIGIASSPRKGANSQTLVEHILSGAEKAGAKTELVRLCDLNIEPCIGCNDCKKSNGCVQKDDFAGLVSKLETADAVVFGSPVYWGRLNAQAYPVIDRLYSLLKSDFSTDFPKGKKFVVALTCGGMGAEAVNPVNEYAKHIFSFLGFADAGFVWQNHCFAPDDITKFTETIQKAESLGKSLAQ
ncbi:flavodoxin family protein [Methanospirillum lacunae]|uniref:Flavodoxin family protein n=1 Tax=Methanospirillum lacunae TaxID=668570 RepID=A0A2V2NE80_9EURY|nr:flavodoxin family protein [Methanospirillum lacunae]PWR74728.1 flavodoxin family protein [Methanospirillum lacunae]